MKKKITNVSLNINGDWVDFTRTSDIYKKVEKLKKVFDEWEIDEDVKIETIDKIFGEFK